MAKVGAQRAAELTGKSKSTIQRAMNSGKISYEMDNNNRRTIDVSELERVYGLAGTATTSNAVPAVSSQAAVEAELKKATDMLEMERMKMRIKALETQLESTETNLDDVKAQRDQWQKQAQQVLITSQYSQKQAEEYKSELKTREETARRRRAERERAMSERMNKMQGQNQNAQSQPAQKSQTPPQRKLTDSAIKKDAKSLLDVQGLWKKIRGGKAA